MKKLINKIQQLPDPLEILVYGIMAGIISLAYNYVASHLGLAYTITPEELFVALAPTYLANIALYEGFKRSR